MAAAGLRFDPTKENPDRCVCDHCALDLYDFEAGAPEQSLALHAYGVMRPGILLATCCAALQSSRRGGQKEYRHVSARALGVPSVMAIWAQPRAVGDADMGPTPCRRRCRYGPNPDWCVCDHRALDLHDFEPGAPSDQTEKALPCKCG